MYYISGDEGKNEAELRSTIDEDDSEPPQGFRFYKTISSSRKRNIIITVLVVAFIMISCAVLVPFLLQKKSTSNEPWNAMRLPISLIPTDYDLSLDVDMENDVYNGQLSITIRIIEKTKWILLHAVGSDIKSVIITNHREELFDLRNKFFHEINDFYVIQTKSLLEKGKVYSIKLVFVGNITSNFRGFYRSYYHVGMIQKKLASTLFESIDARRVFPCFDEPNYKAVFTLSLTHSTIYNAISNMPIHGRTRHGQTRITTRFQPSLQMSTYTLFWIISEFSCVKKINYSNPELRAWGPKDEVIILQYTNDITGKLLRYYEKYFDVRFPLEKLDTVTVPQFRSGILAMENWGAISYKSNLLIQDENNTSQYIRQLRFIVIAHELVHQWFGNLVTMKFWSDIWLNEGFASNFALLGGDNVDKSMDLEEEFLTRHMLPALDADAYLSSSPLWRTILHKEEIEKFTNTITYLKGSCIVEMLKQYIGAEDFQRAMQMYLKMYSYKNANQSDLWDVLGFVSGKDIRNVFDTWTLQPGYPLISVNRINATHLHIQQHRFMLEVRHNQPVNATLCYHWKVPLILLNPKTKETKSYLLEDQQVMINIPEEYSILNPNHLSFYRVHYDIGMRNAIKRILFTSPNILSSRDRAGFISDQFNLVKAGFIDIDSFLDMLRYVKEEKEYSPWKVAFESLSYISNRIDDENVKLQFNYFVRNITSPSINLIKWNNPASIHKGFLQIMFLREACTNGVIEQVNHAKVIYTNWMKGKETHIRSDLLAIASYCAIANGPHNYWVYSFEKYKITDGNSRRTLLTSLAATRNESTIKFLLNYTLDKRFYREDAFPLLSSLTKYNSKSRGICWEFIKGSWKAIIGRYGRQWLSYAIEHVLKYVSSYDVFNSLVFSQTYFKKSKLKQKLKNEIYFNIRWNAKHSTKLSDWLNKTIA